MKIFALFPGQGSQKVGMGKTLWETSPLAKERFAAADEVLGFSLSKLCLEGPADELNQTQNAQPAILTVSIICYELFKQQQNVLPQLAAGHSLGEFSALVAAGALRFEDAVSLVHRRGNYMQQAVPVGSGKMVAVLGKERQELEAVCAEVTSGVVEVANINAPGQIVIAGEKAAVEEAVAKLSGTRCIDLPVTVPSHTSLMKPAAEALAKDLADIEIRECQFPVVTNVAAAAVKDPANIKASLVRQLTSPVLWTESMNVGIAALGDCKAVEFGFGNVLSGLLKRINPAVPRVNVDSGEAIAQFT